MDMYSHWLEQAYPQASQRQEFFKSLIKDKVISHANFRLAHLLSEKRLARLVVTPNFDDFLSRALTLFGVPHIVCDHPKTVERIDPEANEIQIVHVHGTYWFYDCCNLRDEIEAMTQDSREESATMMSLLDDILRRRSALVMGYAGWEGDVIMSAIKRRLKGRLGTNLYWFCFRQNERDLLKSVLGNHRDVCLVVPQPSQAKPDDQKAAQKMEPGTGPAELEAYFVLDKMVDVFTQVAPHLTRDPIQFFGTQLKRSFPPANTGEDTYHLVRVLGKVERAAQLLLDAEQQEREADDLQSKIEKVTDAVRRAAYQEAIAEALQVADRISKPHDRETLMELLFSAANGLKDNSETEASALDLVVRLARNGGALPAASQVIAARAMVGQGVMLRDHRKRPEDAIKTFDEVIRRFGESAEPGLRDPVAKALVNKGFTLAQLNRIEDTIAACDGVLSRFGADTDPGILISVGWALNNKAIALGQLNRAEEAVAVCEDLERRFRETTDPALHGLVARALFNKGYALWQLQRTKDAAATFEEIVKRFGELREPVFQEALARALVNLARAYDQLGQNEDVVRVSDEYVRRFQEASEPMLRLSKLWALTYKGHALIQLGRKMDAIAAFDQVVSQAGTPEDPAFREPVVRALFNKGVVLTQLELLAEAEKVFQEVVQRVGDNTEPVLQDILSEAKAALGEVAKATAAGGHGTPPSAAPE